MAEVVDTMIVADCVDTRGLVLARSLYSHLTAATGSIRDARRAGM
jgi:hypothetical protein